MSALGNVNTSIAHVWLQKDIKLTHVQDMTHTVQCICFVQQ